MKELFLMLLMAGSAVAQSPTNQAVMKGSPARATVSGSRPQPTPATRVSATNDIRIVEGKAYHVLSASNWVTLPGSHERARYARSSNYGPVFSLEKRMAVRYRQHAGEGTRVWYEPYQEIAIKNYPERKLVAGALLPTVRVLPIRTTSEGIAVYDYGLPARARSDGKR